MSSNKGAGTNVPRWTVDQPQSAVSTKKAKTKPKSKVGARPAASVSSAAVPTVPVAGCVKDTVGTISEIPKMQALAGQSHKAHAGSGASLKDLCIDDKRRLATLVKELADVTESRELAIVHLQEERMNFEQKLTELKDHHDTLLHSREGLEQQYRQSQELLKMYRNQLVSQEGVLAELQLEREQHEPSGNSAAVGGQPTITDTPHMHSVITTSIQGPGSGAASLQCPRHSTPVPAPTAAAAAPGPKTHRTVKHRSSQHHQHHPHCQYHHPHHHGHHHQHQHGTVHYQSEHAGKVSPDASSLGPASPCYSAVEKPPQATHNGSSHGVAAGICASHSDEMSSSQSSATASSNECSMDSRLRTRHACPHQHHTASTQHVPRSHKSHRHAEHKESGDRHRRSRPDKAKQSQEPERSTDDTCLFKQWQQHLTQQQQQLIGLQKLLSEHEKLTSVTSKQLVDGSYPAVEQRTDEQKQKKKKRKKAKRHTTDDTGTSSSSSATRRPTENLPAASDDMSCSSGHTRARPQPELPAPAPVPVTASHCSSTVSSARSQASGSQHGILSSLAAASAGSMSSMLHTADLRTGLDQLDEDMAVLSLLNDRDLSGLGQLIDRTLPHRDSTDMLNLDTSELDFSYWDNRLPDLIKILSELENSPESSHMLSQPQPGPPAAAPPISSTSTTRAAPVHPSSSLQSHALKQHENNPTETLQYMANRS